MKHLLEFRRTLNQCSDYAAFDFLIKNLFQQGKRNLNINAALTFLLIFFNKKLYVENKLFASYKKFEASWENIQSESIQKSLFRINRFKGI